MFRVIQLIILILVQNLVHAASMQVIVLDQYEAPVVDAVVEIFSGNLTVKTKPSTPVIVDQINKQFIPHITTITVGTLIEFPNNDDIRHHVYSFSPANIFELPLYMGTPANPVVFDTAGVVVLGCNIHDWMRAYIYVAKSDRALKTNRDGEVRFGQAPPGKYKLTVWHPQISKAKIATEKTVVLTDTQQYKLQIDVKLRPKIRIRRSPSRRSRDY